MSITIEEQSDRMLQQIKGYLPYNEVKNKEIALMIRQDVLREIMLLLQFAINDLAKETNKNKEAK